MTELLQTEWRWYAESSLPLWAMLPLAIIAGYFMLRWLRAERRRTNLAARLLPVTAVLLVVLATALIVQPAWVRIDTWTYPAEQVVVLDESASMERPLADSSVTGQLDALAFKTPAATANRSLAPRNLASALANDIKRAAEIRRGLRRGLDEREQQLPPGPELQTTMKNAHNWFDTLREARRAELETLQQTLQEGKIFQLAEDEDAAAEQVLALADMLSAPPTGGGTSGDTSPDTDTLKSMIHRVETVEAAMRSLVPTLHILQANGDRTFAEAGGSSLVSQFESAATLTRRDAAQQLLASIQTPVRRVSTAPRPVDRDKTDLHATLARLLDNREDRAIGNIILLSDGGQNSIPDGDLPRRIRNAAIRLTVTGVGLPDTEEDIGILDWYAPAILTRDAKATLRVQLKTVSDDSTPVTLELRDGNTILATPTVEPNGKGSQWTSIPFSLTKLGRHRLQLSVTTANANPDNDHIEVAIDVRQRRPRVLLIGDEPNWDTTYWLQAGGTAGLTIKQRYTGLDDAPPERGDGRQEVPKTAAQWARYDTIIMHGKPFKGFGAEDAQALFEAVAESGRTLVLLADQTPATYIDAVADRFGWETGPPSPLPTSRLQLTSSGRYLPLMRIGPDGAVSARLIAAFNDAKALRRIPSQNLPLLVADGDNQMPVLSLGFYGRGKVLLSGIVGLYRLAEYGQAAVLERLLTQLMADASTPPNPSDDTELAVYPDPPVYGQENLLIAQGGEGPAPAVDGTPLPVTNGTLNRIAVWTPETLAEVQLTGGAETIPTAAVHNPGLEEMFYEFNEPFLKDLAQAADGHYLSLHEAATALAQLRPEHRQRQTARRYAPTDHWWLIAALALLGTAHWVLRKLSGLAM